MIQVIKKAKEEELEEIYDLYSICRQDLEQKDILMWDDSYPTRDLIQKEIQAGTVFLIKKRGKIICSFVLSDYLDDLWKSVKWEDNKFLGLHLLAVHPEYQRNGYGNKIVRFSENFAKVNNYSSVHLDVLSKNKAAIKLYKQKGYKKVGKLIFDFKPAGFQEYHCYEKVLCEKDDIF